MTGQPSTAHEMALAAGKQGDGVAAIADASLTRAAVPVADEGALSYVTPSKHAALTPFEQLSLQYEHDLRRLANAFIAPKQNKQGVDLDPATGKAAGYMRISVLEVSGVRDAVAQHALLGAADVHPSVYISSTISPSSACEKGMKKHLRTAAIACDSALQWREALVFRGLKATTFTVKIAINCAAGIITDVHLGEAEIHASDFLDQREHQQWLDLKSSAPSTAALRVRLAITFEYNAQARHAKQVAALEEKKKHHEEYIAKYLATAALVNAGVRHPAAFGSQTAAAELYIPGNRFNIDHHHPAAVTLAPLPDKSRVVTPFGRGVIVSYRAEAQQYVVQMDKDPAAKNATLAYLRYCDVHEEPDEPHLKMFMHVKTPYGYGEIVEIRAHDDVIVVKNEYARMYMHRRDVTLPAKRIDEMNTRELIDEAISFTEVGNEQFSAKQFDVAVHRYLRALGYLQRVDQDFATHKEKASLLQTMIRCHLNIATCKLKTETFADAEIACSNAIHILDVLEANRSGKVVTWMGRLGISERVMFEEWPQKARFRRAKARLQLGHLEDAKNDLVAAVKLNPKDKQCRQLLMQVNKRWTKHKKEERKAWGGIFAGSGEAESDGQRAKDGVDADGDQGNEGAIRVADPGRVATIDESDETSVDEDVHETANVEHGAAASIDDETEDEDNAEDDTPWYHSPAVLATASLVTAGVAALAIAMKRRS